MTPISAAEAAFIPLVTDDDVLARVDDLVGKACVRQLWMFFLDDADIQLPVVVPMSDYPFEVTARGADRELAMVIQTSAILTSMISQAMMDTAATKLILVWERYNGSTLTARERRWVRQTAEACREEGIALRGQLLSYRRGVRWIAIEEYEPPAAAIAS